MNRELGHEGLASTGRSRHNHAMARLDRPARLDLEIVQRKRVAGEKILEKAHISPHYHETSLKPLPSPSTGRVGEQSEPGWGGQETER